MLLSSMLTLQIRNFSSIALINTRRKNVLKSFAEKRNGIKLYKNILLNVTSAVEFVNEKYDPFDFHLSGWSEHLSYDIDSYDDVLEDLYEKYKGTGKKMPPEIKLLLLIIASASAFHFTKSQSNTSKVNMGGANILGNLMNNKTAFLHKHKQ
jgi:hypothetical protein